MTFLQEKSAVTASSTSGAGNKGIVGRSKSRRGDRGDRLLTRHDWATHKLGHVNFHVLVREMDIKIDKSTEL